MSRVPMRRLLSETEVVLLIMILLMAVILETAEVTLKGLLPRVYTEAPVLSIIPGQLSQSFSSSCSLFIESQKRLPGGEWASPAA